MSLLTTIFGGGVGQLVKDVVGTFKLSPEAKLEVEREMAAREHELRLKDYELEAKLLDAQTKEIEAASANIRAEAASSDKYTSRARPTFLYLMYIILAWNYIILPIVQMSSYQAIQPINFPEELVWLFGSGFLGYTGARSWDKWKKP